jgi:hypothetical protein
MLANLQDYRRPTSVQPEGGFDEDLNLERKVPSISLPDDPEEMVRLNQAAPRRTPEPYKGTGTLLCEWRASNPRDPLMLARKGKVSSIHSQEVLTPVR